MNKLMEILRKAGLFPVRCTCSRNFHHCNRKSYSLRLRLCSQTPFSPSNGDIILHETVNCLKFCDCLYRVHRRATNASNTFPQPPVPSCAAGTASTPGGAASATAAGRAPSATFLPPSVWTLSAVGTGCAWRGPVSATQATKDPAVIKVTEWKKNCSSASYWGAAY